MARIEIEESALDSIRAMAPRLQEERDEALRHLCIVTRTLHESQERIGYVKGSQVWKEVRSADTFIDRCTSTHQGDGMNREDVIRIAKESGAWEYFEIDETVPGDIRAIQALAAAIRAATKKEDAGICDELEMRNTRAGPADCGAAIRASK